MSRDLIEPEGVDSTEEPPPSPPTAAPTDHADEAPVPMGEPRPAGPGQELAEGEG